MNKKIKNATVCKADNITFKSKFEKAAYEILTKHFEDVKYEPATHRIIEDFEVSIPFYDKETNSQYNKRRAAGDRAPRKLVLKSKKFQGLRYTPDFYFKYNDLNVYIEIKGIENDVFYIKKKLFLRYLDSLPGNHIYFEICTKTQLLQAIEIIKNYESTL